MSCKDDDKYKYNFIKPVVHLSVYFAPLLLSLFYVSELMKFWQI